MANIKPLSKELQKIAEDVLNEVPESIANDLQAFKSWLEQQAHLKSRLDEQFLIQFLRNCEYNLEMAKKKIELFYTIKTKFPEFSNVTDVNNDNFRKIHNYGIGVPLPRPFNDNGARIYVLKLDGDVAKGLVDIEQIYSVVVAMNEIMIMEDPYACINGIIYFVDLKEVNFEMASKFTPFFLKKLITFFEHALPMHICSGHLINIPPVFHKVVNIMKSTFSEKFRPRVHFYDDNFEEMYKILPKNYLPIEYGGENGCICDLVKDYNKKWLEYTNYFKENANYGISDNLKIDEILNLNGLSGFEGLSEMD